MAKLSSIITLGSGLKKNDKFQNIVKKMTDSSSENSNLFSVLALRFWCHAHIYSPVFSLLIIDIINKPNSVSGQHTNFALTLFLVSLGSLSFALFDSLGGVFADKKGCKTAIRLGILGMIVFVFLFSLIAFFSSSLREIYPFESIEVLKQFNLAIILTFILQSLIGLPLALIDSADTVLTKKITSKIEVLNQNDEDNLEAICTRLKYSGLALASFIGCLLYVIVKVWLPTQINIMGAILFLLTVVSQIVAFYHSNKIDEPIETNVNTITNEVNLERTSYKNIQNIKISLVNIYSYRELTIWVLILAVIEGWLLFSASYFQLDALKHLTENTGNNIFLVLFIPFVVWFLMKIASFGSGYFTSWLERESKQPTLETKLRSGNSLAIPPARLLAACQIIGVMVIVYVLHLFSAKLITDEVRKQLSPNIIYLVSLIPLCFYAIYQLLRGFASPLLKTTINNLVQNNNLQNPTATLSFATGFGRLFHSVTTMLFCLILLLSNSPSSPDQFKQALAATVIVIILALLILNVLCSVILDRKQEDEKIKTLTFGNIFEEIKVIYLDRSFRLAFVKGSFIVCLVMSNILAPHRANIGELLFIAGAIPYAITFMLVDTIAEIEGKTSSRKLWFSGVLSYFLVAIFLIITINLPIDSKLDTNLIQAIQIFDNHLKYGVLGFLLASFCSFSIAQYLDIWLYILLKKISGNAIWFRSNVATFFSQTLDTIIFWLIAFWFINSKSLWELPLLISGQLVVKWLFSLLYTPLLYGLVSWVDKGKKTE